MPDLSDRETIDLRIRYLTALFDNAPIQMNVKDRAGRYLLVNPQFERLFVVKYRDIIGKRPEAVHSGRQAASCIAHDREVMTTKKSISYEEISDTALGRRTLQTVKFPVFNDDGSLIGLAAMVSDVTEQRQLERALIESDQKMRVILDNVPVGIFMRDRAGRYVIANAMVCRIAGCSVEAAIGRTPGEIFDDAAVRSIQKTDTMVFSSRQSVSYEETVWIEGQEHVHEVQKFPILDASGAIQGIGGIKVDITARKKIENDLKIVTRAAEVANQAKSAFLANMSHEIRTPLNAIVGFSQILDDAVFGPIGNDRYRDYVKDIHRSGVYLAGLIGDILDLVRIESGEQEFVDNRVRLEDILVTAFRSARVQADEKEVRLSCGAAMPVEILVDAHAMGQVLKNLLSNAVKFTPSGGRVDVSLTGGADGAFEIVIEDSGIGIPQDQLDHVFEAFTQLRAHDVQGEPG